MNPKVAKFIKLARKHLRVWLYTSKINIMARLINTRFGALVFIGGKFIRLGFQVIFIWVILKEADSLAGYSMNQALFILLTLNLTGTIIQLFLRAVYLFRQRVVSGSFDFLLLFPVNELFFSLFSDLDPMDLVTIIPYALAVAWFWTMAGFPVTIAAVTAYILFIIVALIFAIAWHTVIISFGILFLEADNLIMVYRDIESMARLPLEVYGRRIELFLTFLVPIAVIAAIPAKIAFSLISPWIVLPFFLFGLFQVYLANRFWHFALRRYSSASS